MIRYKPKDYAQALIQSIKTSPEKEKEILKSFVRALASHRDFSKWRKILEIFEKLYIKEFDEKFIDVYVGHDNRKYQSKVLEAVPRGADVQFHTDPDIIGGIKILLNKEILIDGSVQRRITRLFNC